jgi:bifunctional DNA-binding transcriptional regulator/antitoxin component of YhaV-PrlF toxin-antitoxin module
MEVGIISADGLVAIPDNLMAAHHLKKGGKVILEETTDGIVIKPLNKEYFMQFSGMLAEEAPSFEEYKTLKAEERANEEKQ